MKLAALLQIACPLLPEELRICQPLLGFEDRLEIDSDVTSGEEL